MYLVLAGQTPLEAIDRMAQEALILPSQLGVKINKPIEKTAQSPGGKSGRPLPGGGRVSE